ncbi:unnamed protein product [Scytosiphon promiscuus]
MVVLAIILMVSAWLLWPILLSLRIDRTTTMSWATVWIPLWIADSIGLLFFVFLVSWGRIQAPSGWQGGEWRDPYPMPMRVLALVKWMLLVLFQAFLVLRLDNDIAWLWTEVLSPLMAWVCIRVVGELCRIFLQKKRLFLGRTLAAVKAIGEATILVLQVWFVMWRLDGEVDWSWWVVFIPTWLYHVGQPFSWCINKALAVSFLRGLEDREGATEEQQRKMIEASLLMDNAKHSRQLFAGTLVTSVLAVNLAAGADYSAFFVFLPQFFSAVWFTFAVTCLVCFGNRRRGEAGESIEEEGFNTGV